jgi:acyl carrier protein
MQSSINTETALRDSLVEVLGVDRAQVSAFGADTALFGTLPELDSMAVATLLTDLEDRLGILIEDDEIDAEIFETFGSLLAYLRAKTGG